MAEAAQVIVRNNLVSSDLWVLIQDNDETKCNPRLPQGPCISTINHTHRLQDSLVVSTILVSASLSSTSPVT